jgi:hypothetical protein
MQLSDPQDEFILELAVAARCDAIVTSCSDAAFASGLLQGNAVQGALRRAAIERVDIR